MQSNYIENRLTRVGTRVLTTLGRQEWLDRPSYRLENVVSLCYNALGRHRDRVAAALHGVWLGHPVHPPLASFASGAVGTTVALDAMGVLASRATGSNGAERLAQQALGLGIVASLAAAATGVTDWQHTHERERRIGLVHGVVNTIATGLYAKSWWDRRRGRHRRGAITAALGYGLTAAGSYLGGALVFGSGIGIDQSGERLRSPEWRPVVSMGALRNGQLRRAEMDGVGVVLCRTGDAEVFAFGEHCPHLAAPMVDGWVEADRGRIVCPWHGSRFAIDSGEVLRGPAAAPLPLYPTRVRDGVVEVRGVPHSPSAGKGVHK